LNKQNIGNSDFVYFDPPYFVSSSEYNKLWNEDNEIQLYNVLDHLHANGIKFGLSNLHQHKEKTNHLLEKWMQKYNVHEIKSNYISFNDNTIKVGSREVFVTNYG
jgi:site-specific DNA-adenine methylase